MSQLALMTSEGLDYPFFYYFKHLNVVVGYQLTKFVGIFNTLRKCSYRIHYYKCCYIILYTIQISYHILLTCKLTTKSRISTLRTFRTDFIARPSLVPSNYVFCQISIHISTLAIKHNKHILQTYIICWQDTKIPNVHICSDFPSLKLVRSYVLVKTINHFIVSYLSK